MRLAWLPILLIGCTDPLALDATSTRDDLDVQAHAQYTRCDDHPCTLLEVELFHNDDSGSRYAPDVAARVSVDGLPPLELVFEPYVGIDNGGKLVATFDGWIDTLDLEATSGPDRVTVSTQAPITTPDETAVVLPDVIVLGSSYTMTWKSQEYAQASVLFATNVPAVRFGFLMAQKRDTGSLKLETSLLDPAGIYNIALYREITLESDGHSMTWGSNWQKKVTVKNTPVD
jgi:hypothetical protein